MYVNKQWFKNSSPIWLRIWLLTKFIEEKLFSTVALATCKSNANFRSKYTNNMFYSFHQHSWKITNSTQIRSLFTKMNVNFHNIRGIKSQRIKLSLGIPIVTWYCKWVTYNYKIIQLFVFHLSMSTIFLYIRFVVFSFFL